MIRFKVDRNSVERLKRNLQQYSKEKQVQLSDEVKKSAIRIETAAKQITPVDTGRLRSSIHFETVDDTSFTYSDNNGNSFKGDLPVKPGNAYEAVVGTNVEYAAAVEFGLGRQRPQPYLRPAVEQERKVFEKNVKSILAQ